MDRYLKGVQNPYKLCFVFGSNKAGIHGAGAARYAKTKRGAVHGIGEGFTGHSETPCYALPTKGYNIEVLSLEDVARSIQQFLMVADTYLDRMGFMVTRVGCGLGGHKDSDIAPLFEVAPANCLFDTEWMRYLGINKLYWGTYGK